MHSSLPIDCIHYKNIFKFLSFDFHGIWNRKQHNTKQKHRKQLAERSNIHFILNVDKGVCAHLFTIVIGCYDSFEIYVNWQVVKIHLQFCGNVHVNYCYRRFCRFTRQNVIVLVCRSSILWNRLKIDFDNLMGKQTRWVRLSISPVSYPNESIARSIQWFHKFFSGYFAQTIKF